MPKKDKKAKPEKIKKAKLKHGDVEFSALYLPGVMAALAYYQASPPVDETVPPEDAALYLEQVTAAMVELVAVKAKLDMKDIEKELDEELEEEEEEVEAAP